jgi:hypothetical protein
VSGVPRFATRVPYVSHKNELAGILPPVTAFTRRHRRSRRLLLHITSSPHSTACGITPCGLPVKFSRRALFERLSKAWLLHTYSPCTGRQVPGQKLEEKVQVGFLSSFYCVFRVQSSDISVAFGLGALPPSHCRGDIDLARYDERSSSLRRLSKPSTDRHPLPESSTLRRWSCGRL